jgi:hypothetical protein
MSDDDQMRVHRRQFVIGPAPVLVDEDWTSAAITEGVHLSYHQALPVAETRDRDGRVWYLLGIAMQTDPARAAPSEEIATVRSGEVDALPFTWSGRWALVGGGALRTDAALFGCFYARDSRDGKLLMSSSAALLHDLLGEGDPSPPLRYRVGMEWYPPPASRFAGINCLLPSQALAYGDEGQPLRHRPLVEHRVKATYDETLAHIETSLRTAVRNLAGTGRPLWLSLTGGYDTRALLAAMWREKLDFTTFTWDIPTMSRADRTLPPLLASDAGVPHQVISRRNFNDDDLRAFDQHSGLHTADLDRELIPWGQYAQLPEDAIVLLGNVFSLGALYFYTKLPAHPDSVAESVEHAYGFAKHHADSPAHQRGIREWADWIDAHPEPAMDWRDRFFWEQWKGGWCAACEQGADLVEADLFSPANCGSVMADMLRIDPAKRYGKRWQVELTYRMAPFLTDHPYHLGGPLVARLRRGASGWVHHPSKRRFATGRMRSFAARTRRTHAVSVG